jgi:hypothetical protein
LAVITRAAVEYPYAPTTWLPVVPGVIDSVVAVVADDPELNVTPSCAAAAAAPGNWRTMMPVSFGVPADAVAPNVTVCADGLAPASLTYMAADGPSDVCATARSVHDPLTLSLMVRAVIVALLPLPRAQMATWSALAVGVYDPLVTEAPALAAHAAPAVSVIGTAACFPPALRCLVQSLHKPLSAADGTERR